MKSAKFQISGQDVFNHFKFEPGVHKVQRVPLTESKGRVHSSTCQVILMKDSKDDFINNELYERDLKYEYMLAGGQHVNKKESAFRITHIQSYIRD